MPTLRIYDKFGVCLETHYIDQSLTSWLRKNVESYRSSIRPPYSAKLNGRDWPYIFHDDPILESDEIDLTIEPAWSAIPYIVAVIAAYIAYRAARRAASDIPPTPYQNSVEPGKSIYSASARANRAIPSGIIREAAGKFPIFPDYICPVRRKYEDHDEFLYIMLGIGAGYFDLKPGDFYISETPAKAYPNDVEIQVFNPGATVSGNEASENWFQTKEVSDLGLVNVPDTVQGVWTADFSGATITTYLDASATTFPFAVGDIFDVIGGTNPGIYRVDSLSGGSNQTATVTEMELSAVSDGLLQRVIHEGGFSEQEARRMLENTRTLSEVGSPTFTGVSAEATTFEGRQGVNWEGPFILIPENETARYCEVDVWFPQGLIGLDSSNNPTNRTVELSIQWREYGDVEWTTVSATSYTANTYDERGYTKEIDFGSAIRPEMRLRRVTEDSDDTKIVDTVAIRRIKCRLESPTSYPITTAAVKLRGTNALARTSQNQINIRGATRKLPTLQEIQDDANGTPYDLSTGDNTVSYDISFARYISAYDVSGFTFNPTDRTGVTGVSFSSNGLRMMTYVNERVRIFNLAKAFDPSILTYRGYFNLAYTQPHYGARMFNNGQYVIAVGLAGGGTASWVRSFEMSTPYDPYTASADTSFNPTDTGIRGLDFRTNGTRMWTISTDRIIRQYTLTVAWDLSTASLDSDTLNVSAVVSTTGVDIQLVNYSGSEPTEILVSNGTTIYTFDMSTAGDITTGTNSSKTLTGSRFHVDQDYAFTIESIADNSYSPRLYDTQISKHEIVDTQNSRASRSIIRFAANAIYQALGSSINDLVDWDVLSSLDTTLNSRQDYLDAEFVDETTLWEALKIILAPGYCEPVIKDGKFSPVRNAAGTDHAHFYPPDVMLDDGLVVEMQFTDEQESDGVDVEYFSLLTNSNELVECRLAGDSGNNPKRIQLVGVTDETRAWRYGMRERRYINQKPNTYRFRTELDALNSNYADPVFVSSNLFGSQYGTVTAVNGTTITLGFYPQFASGTYYAAFRKPNGRTSGLYAIVGVASPGNQITLSSAPHSPIGLDFTINSDDDQDPTFISIGLLSEIGKRAIVKRISPSDDDQVELLSEEYVGSIFDDDDNSPP